MRLARPGALALSLLGALTLALAAPPGARADGGEELDQLLELDARGGALGGWGDRFTERKRTYPYVEHNGYFRFRTEFFHNGHLGTVIPGDDRSGTSGIPAPLTENAINNTDVETSRLVGTEDAKVIASANLRFRYSPTLHVSSTLRIRTTFDILDNLVMGSTPDFSGHLNRPDVPLSAFATSAAPPSAGVNGFRDGIRVKEAYGEFQPAFLLRVGRQSSHWGLGILSHGGGGIDDDFGNYVDRALLLFKAWGVYIGAMWDYVYSGAISDDPTHAFGQPRDLGNADDVNQWVLAIFQRPLSEQEQTARRAAVWERFEPSFDWGLYTVFRRQDFDLDITSYDLWRQRGGMPSYDQLGLVPRDAWAIIPDLWLRYEKRFNFHSGIRVELEVAGIYGEVANVSAEVGDGTGFSSRKIRQLGAALEAQYNYRNWDIGLHTGFATGDSARGFGVLDRHTLSDAAGNPNRELTAFKFARDYRVDILLFREVIGTVTNALYIKPWVSYDLFEGPEDAFGFRLDLLYAQALVPEATPGNSSFLGVEADLRAFYHDLAGGFLFDLEMGFLFPGAAFHYRPADAANNRDASFAFALRTRLTMKF